MAELTKEEHIAMVMKHLKPGVTLTHTRCMGVIEEHIYTGQDGKWLCGRPTHDTRRIDGLEYVTNDIAPANVTHINRNPVAILDMVVPKEERRK